MAHIVPNTVDRGHVAYQMPCQGVAVVPQPCPSTQSAERLRDAPTPQIVPGGTNSGNSDAGDSSHEENPSDYEDANYGEDLQSEEGLSLEVSEESSSMRSAAAHSQETPDGSQPVHFSQAEEMPRGNLPDSEQPLYPNIPFVEQEVQGNVPVIQSTGPQEIVQVPNPQGLVTLQQPRGGGRLPVVMPSAAVGNGLRILSGGPQRRRPIPNPRLITVLPGQPALQQSTAAGVVHDMIDEEEEESEEEDFGLHRTHAMTQGALIQDVMRIRQRYGDVLERLLELHDDDSDDDLESLRTSPGVSTSSNDPPSHSSSGSS